MNTELTEQERMAINAFLSERWESFCRTAENYLSQEEIDALAEKLEGDG